MSYCRIGEDSDVYVIGTRHDGQDGIECVGCGLEQGPWKFGTPSSMIAHLLVHRLRGDRVPGRALDRLRDERDGIPHETDVQAAIRDLVPTNDELAGRALGLDAHTVVRNWLRRHVRPPHAGMDYDEWLDWAATNFLADPEIAVHLRPVRPYPRDARGRPVEDGVNGWVDQP